MTVKRGLKKGECKELIIASAQQCFSEKSVDKTTLTDVAKLAGISKGTLYYYYPTKHDLVFDIAGIHMLEITEKMFGMLEDGHATPSWKEILASLFERLLGSKTRSRLHLYLIHESLSGSQALRDRLDATYENWFHLIEEMYCRMGREDPLPKGIARIWVAMLDGLVIQSVACENRLDYKTLAEVAEALVVKGV
ncbi:MAG: TetR/AcrR family transcriptional regulator [Desulfobacterium sp.]|nr:TetR/AcrR family transcriptional regulator [Desulfobacterium sp.]